MKKLIVIICICFCICVPQGCTSKELNERMVIQGMGIDYIDDSYSVTVMYMNTDATDQSKPFKTLTGNGRTITEAVTNIVSENGLEPLYSHNSFILLGNSLCNFGVSEALGFCRLLSMPTVCKYYGGDSERLRAYECKIYNPTSYCRYCRKQKYHRQSFNNANV